MPRKNTLQGYVVVISQKDDSVNISVEKDGLKAAPYTRAFPKDLIDLGLPFDIGDKVGALS